jgi:transcriptional regulator of heat shock response
MTQKEYLKQFEKVLNECLRIVTIKNADYANSDDAFANFRAVSNFGIDPKQAILVRMTDKMMRISNLLKRSNQVTDEKITDTLIDLANYSIILKLFIEDQK